jgi:PA domain
MPGIKFGNMADSNPPQYQPISLVIDISGLSLTATLGSFGTYLSHGQKLGASLIILTDPKIKKKFKLKHVQLGCSLYSQRDADSVFGKIAVVRRGECGFEVKTMYAQIAGATGIIVLSSDKSPISMVPGDNWNDPVDPYDIPAMFVTKYETQKLIRNMSPEREVVAKLTAIDSDLLLDGASEGVQVHNKGKSSLK